MARHKTRLLRAPVAIATDGSLVINIHMATDADTPDAALVEALKTGRPIFVGVALTDREADALLDDLDDGVADSTARLAPRFLARRSAGSSRKFNAERPSSQNGDDPDAAPRSSAPSKDRSAARVRRR